MPVSAWFVGVPASIGAEKVWVIGSLALLWRQARCVLWSVSAMGTQAARDYVLLMNDQPETLPPLVAALEARGYRVIVVLTFCEALTWLEVETPRCLIVYRPTLSATDLALLRAHRLWAKRVPLVVVTSVPAPAPLRRALEEGKFSVVPLFVSPDALCQMVVAQTSQEETL